MTCNIFAAIIFSYSAKYPQLCIPNFQEAVSCSSRTNSASLGSAPARLFARTASSSLALSAELRSAAFEDLARNYNRQQETLRKQDHLTTNSQATPDSKPSTQKRPL